MKTETQQQFGKPAHIRRKKHPLQILREKTLPHQLHCLRKMILILQMEIALAL